MKNAKVKKIDAMPATCGSGTNGRRGSNGKSKRVTKRKHSQSARVRLIEKNACRAVQRDQIRWWRGKKWTAVRMHEELVHMHGDRVYSYKSVVYQVNRISRVVASVPEK